MPQLNSVRPRQKHAVLRTPDGVHDDHSRGLHGDVPPDLSILEQSILRKINVNFSYHK